MAFADCMETCLARESEDLPPTVNFQPIFEAVISAVQDEEDLTTWMRRVGLNPASGADVLLALAASALSNTVVPMGEPA